MNSTHSSLNGDECCQVPQPSKVDPKEEYAQSNQQDFDRIISDPSNVIYGETIAKKDGCHPSFIGNLNVPDVSISHVEKEVCY